jgi:hypothetical protein
MVGSAQQFDLSGSLSAIFDLYDDVLTLHQIHVSKLVLAVGESRYCDVIKPESLQIMMFVGTSIITAWTQAFFYIHKLWDSSARKGHSKGWYHQIRHCWHRQ